MIDLGYLSAELAPGPGEVRDTPCVLLTMSWLGDNVAGVVEEYTRVWSWIIVIL